LPRQRDPAQHDRRHQGSNVHERIQRADEPFVGDAFIIEHRHAGGQCRRRHSTEQTGRCKTVHPAHPAQPGQRAAAQQNNGDAHKRCTYRRHGE
jgi:hypothetical protein